MFIKKKKVSPLLKCSDAFKRLLVVSWMFTDLARTLGFQIKVLTLVQVLLVFFVLFYWWCLEFIEFLLCRFHGFPLSISSGSFAFFVCMYVHKHTKLHICNCQNGGLFCFLYFSEALRAACLYQNVKNRFYTIINSIVFLFFQSQFVEVLAVSVSGMVNPLTAQGDFSWQDSLLSAVNSKSQNLVDPS